MAKILLAVLLLTATSVALAAEPARTQPEQPLDQRVINERPVNERPDNDTGNGLDTTGPAQPQGLAPSAPQPGTDLAECRGLPRDARQACMDASRRAPVQAPPQGAPGAPATGAPAAGGVIGTQPARPPADGLGSGGDR